MRCHAGLDRTLTLTLWSNPNPNHKRSNPNPNPNPTEVEVTNHAAAAALIRAAPDLLVLRLRRPPPRLTQPSALHHAARAADLVGMARALDLRVVGNVDVADESGWSALHA